MEPLGLGVGEVFLSENLSYERERLDIERDGGGAMKKKKKLSESFVKASYDSPSATSAL